jgi:hypothetical protein
MEKKTKDKVAYILTAVIIISVIVSAIVLW